MILDVCCGSQMFYFDKNRRDLITMDIRQEKFTIHEKKLTSIRALLETLGIFRLEAKLSTTLYSTLHILYIQAKIL